MREKTHHIPTVDENVRKYIIDLKYLNKHLFSKKRKFLVFVNYREHKYDSIGRSEGHCFK